jgi:RND family efflux transporter MFP subunit
VRRRAKLIAGGAALLVAAGVAAAALVGRSGTDSDAARVQRGDLEVEVEATGRLEAAVAYEIGPPSVRDFWNYNLTWMIPEGSAVAKGDVVARFDATDIDERLRDHRAALEKTLQEKEKEKRSLEVSLRELRLDLVKAEGELKTLDLDLAVPEQLVSDIEIQRLRLQRDLARRRAEFLREKIEFEQELVRSKLELLDVKRAYEESKVAQLEESKAKFDVRAPVAGLVVYVPKRNGDRWEIGEGVWMMAKILKVADVSTLRVEADVLEVDASRIAPGQPAEVTVDAVPGLVLTSAVAEIGRIVHPRSLQDTSKVFDATLPLGAVDPDRLRPGMGVHVRIRTELLQDQLTVPVEAVRSSAEGTYVEVVERGGIERRRVTLGASDGKRVVVSAGLAEGETVRLGAQV